ncbi:hypothetical protein SFUMM280S_02930 [Streptomyces fumanus]
MVQRLRPRAVGPRSSASRRPPRGLVRAASASSGRSSSGCRRGGQLGAAARPWPAPRSAQCVPAVSVWSLFCRPSGPVARLPRRHFEPCAVAHPDRPGGPRPPVEPVRTAAAGRVRPARPRAGRRGARYAGHESEPWSLDGRNSFPRTRDRPGEFAGRETGERGGVRPKSQPVFPSSDRETRHEFFATRRLPGTERAEPTAPTSYRDPLPRVVGLIEVAGAAQVIATVDVQAGEDDWTVPLAEEHPRPVVLVHGTFGNRGYTWTSAAPLLRRHGYRVFRLDYGQYGNPADLRPRRHRAVGAAARASSSTRCCGAPARSRSTSSASRRAA